MNITQKLRRCPQCKRLFALEKQETNITKEENVKIVESATQINLRGEVDRLGNRYVDGKRTHYETVYVCKRCGANHVERMVKDRTWKG